MKNLAICISGSLRSLEYCINNFIDFIYQPNKKDFNIKIFYYLPLDDNINKVSLLKNFNPTILIENDKQHNIPDIIWNGRPINYKVDKVSTAGIPGYIQQLYGIQCSYQLLEDYEKKNNIKFDIIVRCRSDVIFKNPIYIKDYNINKIIVSKFHYWDGLNDRFAFGNRDIMTFYMNMYSSLYKLTNNIKLNIKNAEHFCKYNLDINNINYEMCSNILFNRVRMTGEILNDC